LKRAIPLIGLSLLIAVLVSVPALAGGGTIDLTIVYSNNINGMVKPCPT